MKTLLNIPSRTNHILKNFVLASIILKFSQNNNQDITRTDLLKLINHKSSLKNLDLEYCCNLVRKLSVKGMILADPESIKSLDQDFLEELSKLEIPIKYFQSIEEIVKFCNTFDITKFSYHFWEDIFGCNTKVIKFHKDFTYSIKRKPFNHYSKLKYNQVQKSRKQYGKTPPPMLLKNLLIDMPFVIRLSNFNIVEEEKKLVRLTDLGKKFWSLLDSYFYYCDLIDEIRFDLGISIK